MKASREIPQKVPGLSRNVTDKLVQFMDYHSASRLRRNLRKMLLEYLTMESATENFYFRDLIHDLEAMFELLDVIEADQGREFVQDED